MKSAVFYVDAHVYVHIHVLEYQEEYNDRKGVVGLDQLYAVHVHDDCNDSDAAPALAVGIDTDIDVARKETAMSMLTLTSMWMLRKRMPRMKTVTI